MIRLAARYADQWDTFPELPGAATDGVTTTLAERVAMFEAACLDEGRDPATVRRSMWGLPDAAASEAAYADFARRHLAMGFTDISVVPAGVPVERLRRIAEDVVPMLRAEAAARP